MESQKVYPEVTVVISHNNKTFIKCCYCENIHGHGTPTSGIHFRSSECHRGEYWFKVFNEVK